MAGYVKLKRSIWADREFTALDPVTQRTYLMLISHGDLSACGVMGVTCGRWAHLSGNTTADDIRAELTRLELAGFVLIDESTEELWVRTYIQHDEGFLSPNGRTALRNACQRVVSPTLNRLVSSAIRKVVEPMIPKMTAQERAAWGYEGATEAPSEGADWSSESLHKPAALSHDPSASSQQPGDLVGDPLSFLSDDQRARAAAALEKWFPYRLAQPDVKLPARLEPTLRKQAPQEHHANLAKVLSEDPDASVEDLCVYALKMPRYAVKESA